MPNFVPFTPTDPVQWTGAWRGFQPGNPAVYASALIALSHAGLGVRAGHGGLDVQVTLSANGQEKTVDGHNLLIQRPKPSSSVLKGPHLKGDFLELSGDVILEMFTAPAAGGTTTSFAIRFIDPATQPVFDFMLPFEHR